MSTPCTMPRSPLQSNAKIPSIINKRERILNRLIINNCEIFISIFSLLYKSALMEKVSFKGLITGFLPRPFSVKGTVTHHLKFQEYSLFYLNPQLRMFVPPWAVFKNHSDPSYLTKHHELSARVLEVCCRTLKKVNPQSRPVSEGKSL